MTAKKRDYPHHDLVWQCLPGLILNTVLGITQEIGDPCVARLERHGGVYPSRVMRPQAGTRRNAPFRYAGSLFAALW